LPCERPVNDVSAAASLDPVDHALIKATQAGLPLLPRPYQAVGEALGISGEEVMRRMRRLQEQGVIRRIAAVPNHYAVGYRANGMTVWDVVDERVDQLGLAVGALPFVSHCYNRRRRLPEWPYNLFAMVHGRTRDEVEEKVRAIEAFLGPECRAHEVLYSTRILKKTGLRLVNGLTV
jgi:DNA-binding Lrp family transcriptional regulator